MLVIMILAQYLDNTRYNKIITVMKKYLLVLVLAMMSGLTVKGQFFVASYGNVQAWDLPQSVLFTLEDDFWDYDLLHARRVFDHGYVTFDLVLQRGPVFKTVTLNRRGRIVGVYRTNYFPLTNHICSDFCGFHSNYYYTYYRPHYHGHQHYFGCGHHIPQVQIVYHGNRARVYHDYKPGRVKYHYDKPQWQRYQNSRSHAHNRQRNGRSYDYDRDERRYGPSKGKGNGHKNKNKGAGYSERSRASVDVDRGRSSNGYRYSRDESRRRSYH